MFKYYDYIQRLFVYALLTGMTFSVVQAAGPTSLTVTINQQTTQVDPVLLNGTASTKFVAAFSSAITSSSFTSSDIKTTGSTATGIVIQSVTEIAPLDGTTFEIVASATGSGTIVLSTTGDTVTYTPITSRSYSTPTSPYQIAASGDKAYVGTYNGGGLYEINATTNAVRLFSGLGGMEAVGTVMARNGLIYVAGSYGNGNTSILRFAPPGLTMTTMATVTGAISYLNVDSQGNAYTYTASKVVKVTPAGVVNLNWATTPEIMTDTLLSIDSQDNLYLRGDSGKLWKLTQAGVFTVVNLGVDPKEGSNQVLRSYGSDLYFFNISPIDAKTVITKLDAQGNINTVFDLSKPHPGITAMTDFEMTPDGRFLIVGNAPGSMPIFIYDPITNTSQTIASPANVNPTKVFGMAVSAAGIFYQNNNSEVSYQVASGLTVVTATDANGNHSQSSTSTDNTVTLRTAAEMQALALDKIKAYANNNTQPAPTLEDYVTAGVTGVTAETLPILNSFVDASTGADVDTTPEVQALMDAINAALAAISAAQAKIVAYANDKTQPAPTLVDYQTLGSVGVTADNLVGVNQQVDSLSGADVDTPEEVQALIDALNAAQAKIVAYANNNTQPIPTLMDYQTIGVIGVTTSNLPIVNAKIDTLIGTNVDTRTEVQALVDVLVKTLEYTVRRSVDGRYHVYMRPTVSSLSNTSLNGKITLKAPHGTGNERFVVSSVQSSVLGVSWEQSGRTDAPVENAGTDYVSFTFSPGSVTAFNWQAGVEQEIFSFLSTNTCNGRVEIMSNSDPFNQLPNSSNTTPGNQFTNLGWGNSTTNNYLGHYGSSVDCSNALALQVRGFLQGTILSDRPLMRDALRVSKLIPSAQPYTAEPFNYTVAQTLQPTLLNTTGDAAIVDWVLVELRNKATPSVRVAATAALLRKDGFVADANTGSTTLSFPNIPTDNYYIVLRHRNHLGVMTKTALPVTSNAFLVDFTLPATETYGDDARSITDDLAFLWAGDANGDNQIIANGPSNDLNTALSKVLMSPGNVQTNVNYLMSGYDSSDFNMSGQTLFAGPDNDINIVIGNIMLHPKNTSYSGNFIIQGTVP